MILFVLQHPLPFIFGFALLGGTIYGYARSKSPYRDTEILPFTPKEP